MLELALAALALWGWAGMHITVEIGPMSQPNWAAQAWPAADFSECRIVIHPGLSETDYPAFLLHETGHCVGIYEHSFEPQSVMHSAFGVITTTDRLTAKALRDTRLLNRVTVPQLAHR